MSDQTQTQSSEPKTYEAMPPMEEFETLDSETQKELLNKFGVQDQEEEKSKPSSTEEETSKEVQTDSKDEKPESQKTETQDNKPIEEKPDVEKRYKELEAEFTRRSQRMRELERKVEELSKVKQGQESEKKSPLEKLVETNPNAKELIDAIREEVRMNLTKGLETGIKPIQDRLTQQTADENFNKFQSEVKEFLGSPLGKLEKEFNSVAAEYYENQDALLDAARKDPELFSRLKEKAIARNFVKAAKLMGETVSNEDKNKLVRDTGISGKAKTTTTVDDELDLKVFNKKSPEEMRAILDRHGAVKHS